MSASDDVPRRWPLFGFLLALLWLFVRGVALTPTRLVEEFVIGLLVGLPVAFAARRFYQPMDGFARTAAAPLYAGLYLLTFLWELLTANVDVAYRVLAPSMPIDPEVIEVPLRVETDLAVTTIANSITLTPGTLTMDYDRNANSLYVHSIDASDRESVVAPIRRWEDYALRIFDEELGPDDPVPDRPSDGGPGSESGAGTDRSADADGGDDAPASRARSGGDDRDE